MHIDSLMTHKARKKADILARITGIEEALELLKAGKLDTLNRRLTDAGMVAKQHRPDRPRGLRSVIDYAAVERFRNGR